MAVAASLYLGQIRLQRLPWFYTNVVASMSQSWRTFWFGGVDRLGTVTIDKEVGAFWPQALMVRLFGLHPWTLVLPQIIGGLIAVAAVYLAVAEVFDRRSGLLASAAFVLTPVATAAMGHSMEDGLLASCLAVAAYFWARSLTRGWPWLIPSGLSVGLAFQVKMSQAWIVVPAVLLAEVLVVRPRYTHRLARAGLFLATSLITSLAWVAVATLSTNHPFIDGTRDDNAATMVFGYNLLARVGINVPGALPFHAASNAGGAGIALFGPALFSQWGLLLPVAVVGCVSWALHLRGQMWSDPRRRQTAGITMWSAWLLLTLAAFWRGAVVHTSYLTAFAAPISALVGVGGVHLWRRHSQRGGRSSLLLVVALTMTLTFGLAVQRQFPHFAPHLSKIAGGVGFSALVAFTIMLVGRRHPRSGLSRAAIALAIVGALVVPSVWTGSVLVHGYDGSPVDASAGPGGLTQFRTSATSPLPPADPSTSATDRSVLTLESTLAARSPGLKYLIVSNRWEALTPMTEYGKYEVLAIGGFTGAAPTMTPQYFEGLVRSHQARYFFYSSVTNRVPTKPTDDAEAVSLDVIRHCARMGSITIGWKVSAKMYDCSSNSFARPEEPIQ